MGNQIDANLILVIVIVSLLRSDMKCRFFIENVIFMDIRSIMGGGVSLRLLHEKRNMMGF